MAAFQKKSDPGTITTGWIPNKLDSGFQWLDSGFHELDSGFQTRGFRIPHAKIAWIPDSGLPYMGRTKISIKFYRCFMVKYVSKMDQSTNLRVEIHAGSPRPAFKRT